MVPQQASDSPRRAFATLLLALALVSVPLSSCGTLLFEERRGQESGRVDPNVIIMDGILLFFFVIPGVVAFGVDLATGAIYLPPGEDLGEGPLIGEPGILE